MTEAVLDASVVLKWFHREGERHVAVAQALRDAFEKGSLTVVVPRLLHLEILNVAGRRWHWPAAALMELARALNALNFQAREPELAGVAAWTALGLTAYDASYVALAECEATKLITDDRLIHAVAPAATLGLSEIAF